MLSNTHPIADPKYYLWMVAIPTLLVVLELSVVYWAKEVCLTTLFFAFKMFIF